MTMLEMEQAKITISKFKLKFFGYMNKQQWSNNGLLELHRIWIFTAQPVELRNKSLFNAPRNKLHAIWDPGIK